MTSERTAEVTDLRLCWTSLDDPAAAPALADLADLYTRLYGEIAQQEIHRYGPREFTAPDGGFLLLLADDGPVAAGAFRHYDAATAEFKRMWTRPDRRRRGLARRVLAELEAAARARGYTSVHLTTGSRQQDAAQLYVAAGYTPQFDRAMLTTAPAEFRELPFSKLL